MRLTFNFLQKVTSTFGEFDIESRMKTQESESGKTWVKTSYILRFGYWERISMSKLNSILPNAWSVEEIYVDDTDEGMSLWCYEIKEKENY